MDANAGAQPIGDDELATAVSVLARLVGPDEHPTDEFRSSRCRPLRKALVPFLEDMRGKLFYGQDADAYQQNRAWRRERARRVASEVARDRKTLNKTRLRAERLAKLKELEKQAPCALVPDGAVDDGLVPLIVPGGGALGEGAADGADEAGDGAARDAAEPARLHASSRVCYTCKGRFTELHHFYDSLCPACAALNFEKRHQTAELSGRVALVTGARIKIGFHITLKLLRAGARVLATTRFPHDAALRFAAASDFDAWGHRLQICGIDLRDIAGLEQLCAHVSRTCDRLDVIINNACQTIRRPAAYYSHLLAREQLPSAELPRAARSLLALHESAGGASGCQHLRLVGGHAPIAAVQPAASTIEHLASRPAGGDESTGTGAGADAGAPAAPPREAGGGAGSPSGSAPPGAGSDTAAEAPSPRDPVRGAEPGASAGADAMSSEAFPVGACDVNGQQLDLRRTNSWLLRLADVSSTEAAEVLAINTLAPFVINSRLKGVMERTPPSVPKFIVNVSAMEGKFYRQKTPCHPHTNMAKAALNMMTRTSASDYAASGIYMTAVDTGWINDENPVHKALNTARTHNFQTPLDEIDAAARVCDPVFSGVASGQPVHGVFLKDYVESEW